MTQSNDATKLEQIIFDHAPVGLVLADDRVIQTCNDFFAQMFGHTKDDLIKQEFSILYPSYQEYLTLGESVINHPDISNYWDERIMKRKDGSLFWCRVRCRTLAPENRFERAVYSFVDLSKSRSIIELTRREREVVALLAKGKSSKEIAIDLGLSYRTVEIYRSKLLKKYGVKSTPALLNCLSAI